MRRRRWLDEAAYAEVVAVSNLLPGPTSSQVGIVIGGMRAGKLGGLAAWAGFTLPSAVIMLVLGIGLRDVDVAGAGWLHGLELAAAAVVLAAVISLGRTLTPDLPRVAIAAAAAAVALLWSGPLVQAVPIVAAGLLGALVARRVVGPAPGFHLPVPFGRRVAVLAGSLFLGLLVGLPLLREATESHAVELVDAFYRVGSLVFGGGHVVLPLLVDEVVATGWVSAQDFLAGYGAAQALPGPLSTFSAYLGAIEEPAPNGVPGGLLALGAVFLPSFLLLAAVLPLWALLRARPAFRAAMWGTGAAVVGLLAAALWDPIIDSSIGSALDVVFAVALFGLLRLVPAWAVVLVAALAGAVVF